MTGGMLGVNEWYRYRGRHSEAQRGGVHSLPGFLLTMQAVSAVLAAAVECYAPYTVV